MTIDPTRDLVLIKADKPKEQTSSGLFIQEEWKSLPPTGEVVAVGPEVQDFKVGDRVLFARYATVILEDDLRLCPERHIHAKIQ